MVAFKSCNILLISVMICITINIVLIHADIADYYKCMRQIQLAFGSDDTSTNCFSYAVKNYITGEDIPIPVDDNPQILLDLIKKSSKNIKQAAMSRKKKASKRQLASDGSKINSTEQINVKKPHVKVANFSDLISSDPAGGLAGVKSSTGEMHTSSNQAGSSRGPSKPLVKVVNFDDLISSDPAGDSSGLSSSNEEMNVSNSQTDENKDERNYAKLYHIELENMIQGGGVLRRSDFCNDFFFETVNDCVEKLKVFGDTPRSAVSKAFTSFKLSECHYCPYTFKYIQYIADEIYIMTPSKRPQKFCFEFL